MDINIKNPPYKLLQLIPIETKGKPGKLVDLDITNICFQNGIEFNLRKCFYINELNSSKSRGNHSNFNATEILVCLTGTFNIKLFNGIDTFSFTLEKNNAIFINKNIWIEFNNFKECIIMAFVSIDLNEKYSCYDLNEYIKSVLG